jgi:hypothetical protein
MAMPYDIHVITIEVGILYSPSLTLDMFNSVKANMVEYMLVQGHLPLELTMKIVLNMMLKLEVTKM